MKTHTPEEIRANRKKWAEALRSGKYSQCTGVLFRPVSTEHSPSGYCCLGVAAVEVCGLAPPNGLCWNDSDAYYAVDDALGLKSWEAADNRTARAVFTKANDREGKTFAEIADLIDALPDPAEAAPATCQPA